MDALFWIVPMAAGVIAAAALLWRRRSRFGLPEARAAFERDRARLQREFFQAAAASGKPRGLRWKECQWSESVEWVRDRQTGQVHALAGVTISFEAIEGGEMEGVEAVGNLRYASAVFFLQGGQWQTAGRAVFNLNPAEAVEHFKGSYERIG